MHRSTWIDIDGEDLRRMPLHERRKRLAALLIGWHEALWLSGDVRGPHGEACSARRAPWAERASSRSGSTRPTGRGRSPDGGRSSVRATSGRDRPAPRSLLEPLPRATARTQRRHHRRRGTRHIPARLGGWEPLQPLGHRRSCGMIRTIAMLRSLPSRPSLPGMRTSRTTAGEPRKGRPT